MSTSPAFGDAVALSTFSLCSRMLFLRLGGQEGLSDLYISSHIPHSLLDCPHPCQTYQFVIFHEPEETHHRHRSTYLFCRYRTDQPVDGSWTHTSSMPGSPTSLASTDGYTVACPGMPNRIEPFGFGFALRDERIAIRWICMRFCVPRGSLATKSVPHCHWRGDVLDIVLLMAAMRRDRGERGDVGIVY